MTYWMRLEGSETSAAVQSWNCLHPEFPIEPGQVILEVNGVTEPEKMLQEFKSSLVKMLVNTEMSPRQLQVFNTSRRLHDRSKALDSSLEPVEVSDSMCSICHEELVEHPTVRLPCGHCFHKPCVTLERLLALESVGHH